MTKREALKQAQSRWGTSAYVESKHGRYDVGKFVAGGLKSLKGRGGSFEKAFAAADELEQFLAAWERQDEDDNNG